MFRKRWVRNSFRAASVLLTALAVPTLPFAEAADPPALVSPKAIDPPVVPYPEGETKSATVVLELVVDSRGRVSEATVVEGLEPFASAAQKSALEWRYEPAR